MLGSLAEILVGSAEITPTFGSTVVDSAVSTPFIVGLVILEFVAEALFDVGSGALVVGDEIL